MSYYSTAASRQLLQIDTRTQTAYGTLRDVHQPHFQNEDSTFSSNAARAFIQWAGFTFGHAQSYTDIFTLNSYQFGTPQIGGRTDGDGINVAAYTAQFGDGFPFTGEVEERRKTGISAKSTTDLSLTSALTVGSTAADNSNGQCSRISAQCFARPEVGNFGVFAWVTTPALPTMPARDHDDVRSPGQRTRLGCRCWRHPQRSRCSAPPTGSARNLSTPMVLPATLRSKQTRPACSAAATSCGRLDHRRRLRQWLQHRADDRLERRRRLRSQLDAAAQDVHLRRLS